MDRFGVIYSPRAEDDLLSAYEWGVENWGAREAAGWLDSFDALIGRRLTHMPMACPLAPEDQDFEFELRQLAVRRYRVLFRIEGKLVYVLRVRGPFSGGSLEIE